LSLTPKDIKKFAGLYLQANSLAVPEGALEEALNAVLRNDFQISRRRGFYNVFDPGVMVANRIVNFDEEIVLLTDEDGAYHFTDIGTAPNETLDEVANNGVIYTADNRRINYEEANKNLYFTSNEGVKKLESFDGAVRNTGVPPGLDVRGKFEAINGPISFGQVSYRVLWSLRDANSNLFLGSPSDSIVITNSRFDGISYTNPSGNIVRVTQTVAHNLVAGMEINVENATDTAINGLYAVTTIVSELIFEFDKGSVVTTAPGTLDWWADRTARIEFSIPQEIDDVNDGYTVRIYRSSTSGDNDVIPFGDFKLVAERTLTSTEITSGVGFYDDDLITDDLRGEELYTNENSQEGELQANERAPIALDITLYKGYMVYGNVRTRHTIQINVVAPTNIVAGQYIEIEIDPLVRRYVARGGVGNNTVTASASGTGTITVTYTAHGLANSDIVRVSRVTGSLPEGLYTISGVTANTFAVTSIGNSATALDFQGVENSSGYNIFSFDTATDSPGIRVRNTALAIVKAINRDPDSEVYARYISAIDDVPGKIRLTAAGFGEQIRLRASNTATGQVFEPVLPTTFSTVKSDNDELPHVIYVSKAQKSESVPTLNYFEIGARNKAIKRIKALQDSLIILKEDGCFRLTGDSLSSFSIAPIDKTIEIINDAIADDLQNQIIALSNQGIVAISESSVEIISRKIEDVISPILGLTETKTVGCGFGYESDRLFVISTILPGQNDLTVTWVYNILNQTWTQWDVLCKDGVVGPNDTLFIIDSDGVIRKERKNFTKVDYCDQNYDITVDSVDSNLMGALVTSIVAVPQVGDVIIHNSTITRIRAVTLAGANQYQLDFANVTNLEAPQAAILYSGYNMILTPAPFDAGQRSVVKHFSECHLHLKTHGITRATMDFRGQYYSSDTEYDWLDSVTLDGGTLSGGGWGLDPWGQFPWGNIDSDLLKYGSQSLLSIRTLVGRNSARSPWVQVRFKHFEAAEPIELQAITWLYRAYGTRFSR
jgi:hypothetical protein